MKYNFELTVHTPTFIGSGEKLNKIDYIKNEKQNCLNVLNEEKLISLIQSKGLINDYIGFLKERGRNVDIATWMKKQNLYFEVCNKPFYTKYKMNISDSERFTSNDILPFIKDVYGDAYIPGSSLKGLIVSSIIDFKLKGKPNNYLPKYNQELFKKVFGDDYKKYLSKISISDSEPIKSENLAIYKKIDISINGSRQKESSLSVYRESLKANTKTRFSISLNNFDMTIDEIQKALQLRTDYIYGTKGVIGEPFKDITNFLPKEYNKEKCTIVFGGGAGFQSKVNIMGIIQNTFKANEETKKILHLKFDRFNKYDKELHLKDKPISPRCLKATKVNNKREILGICSLKLL